MNEDDTTTEESTEPAVDIAEISEEVAEDVMLKMATARSKIVGEEIVERTALGLLQVLVDETEARHALLSKELFRSHQVLSQFTQRLEAVCRKQLRQSLQHGAQLHKELADEPLMRRQLENECTQERKKRIRPNTPMSYKNGVYAWLTKQISKGQKGDEWLKYCGKHVDPFCHSENSLLAFLRHQGTVRDAAVFHHLRAPPWENVAPQTTPSPAPDVPTHKDILQAIVQSESALIVDPVGSSQTSASPPVRPSSALSLVGPEGDDVHTLLKEAQESFVDLWQTTFPDKELATHWVEHWVAFADLLQLHILHYITSCIEVEGVTLQQSLFTSSLPFMESDLC